jgi:hypothetical protein
MPEAVFRIAFYAFPLIGVYVALRAAQGRSRLAASAAIAIAVPGVCLLLGAALLLACAWLPPRVAEPDVGRFQMAWSLSTLGLAVLAGLAVGAARLLDRTEPS